MHMVYTTHIKQQIMQNYLYECLLAFRSQSHIILEKRLLYNMQLNEVCLNVGCKNIPIVN